MKMRRGNSKDLDTWKQRHWNLHISPYEATRTVRNVQKEPLKYGQGAWSRFPTKEFSAWKLQRTWSLEMKPLVPTYRKKPDKAFLWAQTCQGWLRPIFVFFREMAVLWSPLKMSVIFLDASLCSLDDQLLLFSTYWSSMILLINDSSTTHQLISLTPAMLGSPESTGGPASLDASASADLESRTGSETPSSSAFLRQQNTAKVKVLPCAKSLPSRVAVPPSKATDCNIYYNLLKTRLKTQRFHQMHLTPCCQPFATSRANPPLHLGPPGSRCQLKQTTTTASQAKQSQVELYAIWISPLVPSSEFPLAGLAVTFESFSAEQIFGV